MINDFKENDYLEEARGRVTMAFEDLPVFDKYLQLLTSGQMDVQEVIKQMIQQRSIDTAVGKQLDIIGDIVGQPRDLVDTALLDFFGFQGNPASESYGTSEDESVGGFWWDANSSLLGTSVLTDDQYRVFIKAKIMKNVTRATPEDIIAFLKFVLGVSSINVSVDRGAENVLIYVTDDLDPFKFALLSKMTEEPYKSYFIPKNLGVNVIFATMSAGGFFGYLSVPNAKGYGTLGVAGGGRYSSLT